MATINIFGKLFSGLKIKTDNGKVIIDGKEVADLGKDRNINITVTGNVESLNCNTCVINGNVLGNVEANTVTCGDIKRDVEANTVYCKNVLGDISANTVNKK